VRFLSENCPKLGGDNLKSRGSVGAFIEQLLKVFDRYGFKYYRKGNQYMKRIVLYTHKITEIDVWLDGAHTHFNTYREAIYIEFREHKGVDVIVGLSIFGYTSAWFRREELKLTCDDYGIVIGEYYSHPHIKLIIDKNQKEADAE